MSIPYLERDEISQKCQAHIPVHVTSDRMLKYFGHTYILYLIVSKQASGNYF